MSRPANEVRELMRAVSSKLESADTDTWESEGGACIQYSSLEEATNDPYIAELHKTWSKCAFCGASNGKHMSVLQQHRPRCRWMGDADKFAAMHPNYNKMIAEDDVRHLSAMRAQAELITCKRELTKIKSKAQESHG